MLQGDVNNQVVLVPKDSPAKTFADLKGKRIGYVKATTSHYILLRLLNEAGPKWTDVKPVALTPQDGLAAFSSGAVDAWIIYGVIVQQARRAGARVLRTALGILSGNYVVAASVKALDDDVRRRGDRRLSGPLRQGDRLDKRRRRTLGRGPRLGHRRAGRGLSA